MGLGRVRLSVRGHSRDVLCAIRKKRDGLQGFGYTSYCLSTGQQCFGRIAYFQNGRDSARRMCRGVYDGRRTKTLRCVLPDRILIYMLCAVLRLKRDTTKKNKRQAHFAAGGRRGILPRAARQNRASKRGKESKLSFPLFGAWRSLWLRSAPPPCDMAVCLLFFFAAAGLCGNNDLYLIL